MAQHVIKIQGVADFSSIVKEADGLRKTINNSFGKDGIAIFDEKQFVTLKQQTQNVFNRARTELKKLQMEAKELDKAIKSATDPKQKETLGSKQADTLKKITETEQQLFKIRRTKVDLESGTKESDKDTFKSLASEQVKSPVASALKTLPGVGEATAVGQATMGAAETGAAAGLGAASIVALGALAAAATTAAVAVLRMVSGFQAFQQVVPNLLTLSGMGVSPAQSRNDKAVRLGEQLGYATPEVLQYQEGLNRSFGQAGTPGEDQNRIMNTMLASRNLGMSPEQIISGGNQLRAAGGTEVAQKQMSMILEKAITSGMDKTQASVFLSSAVGLLTELNQSGVANTSQLLGVMSNLVTKNGMSPEMAAKSLGGINSAISNSQGESNAFFQVAAARQGLGSGSLLGTQFAVRQGLTGVDMGALQKQIGDTDEGKRSLEAIKGMGLGDEKYSQKFAGGILDEAQRFGPGEDAQRAKLGFVNQMFGGKTATDAAKTLAILEKIAKGTATDKDRKVIEDIGKDPQETWRQKTILALDATAQNTAEIAAALKNQQIDLGKAVAPAMNSLVGALTRFDEALTKALSPETIKAISGMIGSAGKGIGSAIETLTNLPSNIGKMFDDFIKNPLDFGKAMGQGLVDILSGWWNSAKEYLGQLFGITTGDTLKSGTGKVLNTVSEVGQGAWETIKEGASGFYEGLTGDGAKSAGSNKMLAPVKSATSPQALNAATTPGQAVTIDNGEMINEQRKTNLLLERMARPGAVPRAGRETSKK